MDGAWSLTVNSSAEQFYLFITAYTIWRNNLGTTFIEINRAASAEENGDTVQSQISRCPHITVDELPFLANYVWV